MPRSSSSSPRPSRRHQPSPADRPVTSPRATSMYSRVERFGVVGSTNDIVRDWLAPGVDEVCVAGADEQTRGRGRHGRTWTAPAGSALLVTAGFRPGWLAPERAWRIPGPVAAGIAGADQGAAGLP